MPKGSPGRAPCQVNDCSRVSHARGLCSGHYDIFMRTGSTDRTRRPRRPRSELAIVDGMAHCPVCKSRLPIEEFGENQNNWNGLRSRCRSCATQEHRVWKYGVDVAALLHNQGGKCGICKDLIESTSDGHVDHDHSCCPGGSNVRTCGECIRGILCTSCNNMLGRARDSVEVLQSAIKYLERWNAR